MAIKATIFRVELNIADIDRNYFHDHKLTIARHPSENDVRMMVRLVAFVLNAHEDLIFTQGVSRGDEPDLWRKDLNGNIEVWIELENGATFTTTFSEKGTLRVGPRDHVELKVHGRNIRITDAIEYQSEDNHRIIRKERIFKTNSYRDMYQTIGRKIANNEEGDSIESILISAKIMLDLEEKLQGMKGWGDKYKKAKEKFWSYFR